LEKKEKNIDLGVKLFFGDGVLNLRRKLTNQGQQHHSESLRNLYVIEEFKYSEVTLQARHNFVPSSSNI